MADPLCIEIEEIEYLVTDPSLPVRFLYNGQEVLQRRVQLCRNVGTIAEDEAKRATARWQQALNLGQSDAVKYCVMNKDEVYFVRPFYVGEPLIAYIQQLSGKEKQRQMWRKVREVTVALMDLHKRDVVHGNLKSSNVLVCGDQVRLVDMMAVPMDTTAVFESSPAWLAPEHILNNQESNHPFTKASDIFALGLCIIHAVTGTLPLVNRSDGTVVVPETISDRQQHQLLCDMCNLDPVSRPSIQKVVQRIIRFCDYQYLLELTRRLPPDDMTGFLIHRLKNLQDTTNFLPECDDLLAAVADFVSLPVIDPELSSAKTAIAYSQFHHRLDCLMKESESSTSWLEALRKQHTILDDATISAISLIPWKYRHLFLSGSFAGSPTTKHTYDNRDVVIHVLPHPSECCWPAYERWGQLRHPNVVEFIGFWKAPKRLNGSCLELEFSQAKPTVACGVVCEAFDSKTLIEHVRETTNITSDKIRDLLHQAAVGLAMLHAHDLVHGDINATSFLYANGIVKLRADRVSPAKMITTTNISDSMADEVFRFGVFMLAVVLREISIRDRDALSFLYDERIVDSGIQDLVRRTCANSPSERPTMKILVDCLSLKGELVTTLRETTNDFEYNSLDHAVADRISILRDCIDGLDDDEMKQRLAAIQWRFDQFLETKYRLASSTPSAEPRLARIGKLFFAHSSLSGITSIHEELHLLASFVQQVLTVRGGEELRFEWESIDLVAYCDLLLGEIEAVFQDNNEVVRREIAAWCWYEYNSSPNQFTPDQRNRLFHIYAHTRISTGMIVDPLPDWFIPSYQVDLHEQIGEGAFGIVHRAQWQGSTVAVKLERNTNVDVEDATMIEEANTWFPLRHPRVARMLGAFHFSQRFLLSEYEEHGSLKACLESKNDVTSDDKKIAIWKLLYEAALGLSYLHERGIAHGDLRGDNILVGSDGRAKIGDLGLSFNTATEDQHRIALGAYEWKAPELFQNYQGHLRDGYSLMSDVYALGMCIVEAFTGCAPYTTNGTPMHQAAVKHHVVKLRKLPLKPSCLSDDEWNLVEKMCSYSSDERLKIHQVIGRIDGFASGSSLTATG